MLQAVNAPSSAAVDNAIMVLKKIGALTPASGAAPGRSGAGGAGAGGSSTEAKEVETLTALGRHLAFLPMDPQLGKALIVACLMKCLDPVLVIIAALRYAPCPLVLDPGSEPTVLRRC